ncbi:hypothetical protein DFH09DRAFT_154539 [Mycena vulgaris]|nr:hypothetical protein DFH09DRAFT_154539 [Mycena vulgaris]
MVPSSNSLAVERRRRTERGKKIVPHEWRMCTPWPRACSCRTYRPNRVRVQVPAGAGAGAGRSAHTPLHPLAPARLCACAVFWRPVEIWAHAEAAHVRVLHRTLARPPGADPPIHARQQPHPTTHGSSAGANLGAGTGAALRLAGARVQPLLHIARAPAALAAVQPILVLDPLPASPCTPARASASAYRDTAPPRRLAPVLLPSRGSSRAWT